MQKVPVLGDIPWLGRLFTSNATSMRKTHLMVFLRPTIIRDSKTLSGATAQKYKTIRNEQENQKLKGNDFIEDKELPMLPEWEEEVQQIEGLRKQNEALDLRQKPSDAQTTAPTAPPQASINNPDEVDDIFADNEPAQ